jgi:hypothetical protein
MRRICQTCPNLNRRVIFLELNWPINTRIIIIHFLLTMHSSSNQTTCDTVHTFVHVSRYAVDTKSLRRLTSSSRTNADLNYRFNFKESSHSKGPQMLRLLSFSYVIIIIYICPKVPSQKSQVRGFFGRQL